MLYTSTLYFIKLLLVEYRVRNKGFFFYMDQF